MEQKWITGIRGMLFCAPFLLLPQCLKSSEVESSVSAEPAQLNAEGEFHPNYVDDIKPILDENCHSCHKLPAGPLKSFDTIEFARAAKDKIAQQVAEEKMPPTGPLDKEVVAKLSLWAEQGGRHGPFPSREEDIGPLLEDKCLVCHGGAVDPDLSDPKVLLEKAIISRELIASGTMPPADNLSDSEKVLFDNWFANGLRETSLVSYENDVKPILESRCMSCHGAQQPLLGDLAAVQLNTKEILTSVEGDLMPPIGMTPLTKDEKQIFKRWADHGAN